MAPPRQTQVNKSEEMSGEEQSTVQASGFSQQREVAEDEGQIPHSPNDNLVTMAQSRQVPTNRVGPGQVVDLNQFADLPNERQPNNNTQIQRRTFYDQFEGLLDGPYGPNERLTTRDRGIIFASIPTEYPDAEDFRIERMEAAEVSAPLATDAAEIRADQLGMADTRGQVILLAIGFIVGIVVGFAVARSL